MDPELQVEEDSDDRLKQFTKVVVGAAVGFVAVKLSEDVVDKLFEWKRNR